MHGTPSSLCCNRVPEIHLVNLVTTAAPHCVLVIQDLVAGDW